MVLNVVPALPELFLLAAALALLVVGAVSREDDSSRLVSGLSVLALIIAALIVIASDKSADVAFDGHFVSDAFTAFLKVLLFAVVLAGVGSYFLNILRSEALAETDRTRSPAEILWDEAKRAQPVELAAGGLLYLAGLGFSCFFWIWLVRATGEWLPALPGAWWWCAGVS